MYSYTHQPSFFFIRAWISFTTINRQAFPSSTSGQFVLRSFQSSNHDNLSFNVLLPSKKPSLPQKYIMYKLWPATIFCGIVYLKPEKGLILHKKSEISSVFGKYLTRKNALIFNSNPCTVPPVSRNVHKFMYLLCTNVDFEVSKPQYLAVVGSCMHHMMCLLTHGF